MEKFSGLDSPWHRTLRTGHRYEVFKQGKLLQPSCKQGTSRQSRQGHITHGWMGLGCRGWNPAPAWHLIQLSFCRMLGKYQLVTNTAVNKNTLEIRKTYKSIDITPKTRVFWCHSGATWPVNVEDQLWNAAQCGADLCLPHELLCKHWGKTHKQLAQSQKPGTQANGWIDTGGKQRSVLFPFRRHCQWYQYHKNAYAKFM